MVLSRRSIRLSMKHSTSFDDDGRRRAPRPLPSPQHDGRQHRLPSLVEVSLRSAGPSTCREELIIGSQAVPEIRRTIPAQENIANCPRQLIHRPDGPGQFPTVGSLASSPRMASTARPPPVVEPPPHTSRSSRGRQRYNDYDIRPEMQLPILPGPPARNSDSSLSSGFSDRRTSLASVTTSTTYPGTRRGSPVLPSLSRGRTPEHSGYPNGDVSDPRSIPSLYRNIEPPPYAQEQASLRGGLRQSIEAYPSSSQRYEMAPLVDSQYHPAYGGGPPRQMSFAERQPVEPSFLRENGHHHYADSQRHKRRRGNLPKAVTDTLRKWFADHVGNPYPTEDEKQMLMDMTGLTISQVSCDFCFLLSLASKLT